MNVQNCISSQDCNILFWQQETQAHVDEDTLIVEKILRQRMGKRPKPEPEVRVLYRKILRLGFLDINIVSCLHVLKQIRFSEFSKVHWAEFPVEPGKNWKRYEMHYVTGRNFLEKVTPIISPQPNAIIHLSPSKLVFLFLLKSHFLEEDHL